MGPAVVLVVGAAAVAGVNKALEWFTAWRQEQQAPVPPAIVAAVLALRAGTATAPMLRAAALQADGCAGAAKLATILRRQADALDHAAHAAAGALALEAPEPEVIASPLAGVADDDWSAFVRRARVAQLGSVSPSYRLGAYALSARELTDVGVMVSAHKGDYNGRRGVWLGIWAPGRTQADFLASAAQQYTALADLTQLHAKAILARHRGVIGGKIDEQDVTLSGLLAVARKAGIGGLRQWVSSSEDRAAFPESGALFNRFNGIF